ncbi:MAG: pyridoxal phosphate-dependent aminotransferase [Candidatus Micrarchaeia archaeon]
MILSNRSAYAKNPIEEEDKVSELLVAKGKKVIQLNRGDPPVYFHTPKYIINAYISALRESKTSYSRAEGAYTLVEAIQRRYKRMKISASKESIIVTQGVSEALSFLNSALINQNDMAVLFRPYYPIYMPQLKIFGGNPIMGTYNEGNNWDINTDEIDRKIKSNYNSAKRIKYMLITNPNNPTGNVLSRKNLERIVEIANEHSILLISDEIYDEIVYNNAKFTSIGNVAKGVPHVILNGASKDFDATGFRIGFIIIPENDKVSQKLKEKLSDYAKVRLSVNTPAQYAVAEAMNNRKEHDKAIRNMVRNIEDRVNFATKLLSENRFVSIIRPNAAFYLFPKIDLKSMGFKNDHDFVDKLLRSEYIQTTRGSGFGMPSHIRIVGLPPKDILGYAINKINEFCIKNAKK